MVENEFCGNNRRKKQVRFNTSLKMASSASDHQLPRPLIDIQNLEKRSYGRSESIGPGFSQSVSKSGTPFSKNSAHLPPSSLNRESIQAKTVEQRFSLPKPSVDLELSILDSSEVAKKETALGRSKIYENDSPYCFSPSMMPMQSVYKPTQSEKLFSLSPGMVTSAAQSKKEFPIEKSDANSGLGFFTLPNSAGLYQDKKVLTGPKDDVANVKSNMMNQKNYFDTNGQENINVRQKQTGLANFGSHMQFETNKYSSQEQSKGSQMQTDTLNRHIRAENMNFCSQIPHHSGSRGHVGLENMNFDSQPKFRANTLSSQEQIGKENVNFGSHGQIGLQNHSCNGNGRVPCNENLTYRIPNDQTYRQNMQPVCNKFNCCPNSNSHKIGSVCCVQMSQGCVQNQYQHYEENICKKPETIVDALEMKRKAIEARQNKFTGKENPVTVEYNNEVKQDVVARNNSDEPTVSDLYEIIKLQNKQLQLLQQRVDMLLTVKESNIDTRKLQDVERTKISTNSVIESETAARDDAVNVNCIEHISIGVMTSFEFVMSSNYINKRSVTFNPQANINLERRKDECVQTTQFISGDAVTESKDIAPNLQVSPAAERGINFLDGITPYNKPCNSEGLVLASKTPTKALMDNGGGRVLLYDGVQMDPVTPKMNRKTIARVQIIENSPISEYNEDCFNGMTLDPSPAPAPASVFRYDRSSSDLSLHMRHLATKYNIAPPSAACARRENVQPQFQTFGGDARNEMSLATMQYMQKYHLLSVTDDRHQQQMAYDRGGANYDRRSPQHLKPAYKNPSRILDITTLKQQSKLL